MCMCMYMYTYVCYIYVIFSVYYTDSIVTNFPVPILQLGHRTSYYRGGQKWVYTVSKLLLLSLFTKQLFVGRL